MTVIAALVHNGTIYMGGDSAGVSGYDINIRSDPKVFRQGPFLIGTSGSFRYGNILRYHFDPWVPRPSDLIDPMRYMATTFIDHLRERMDEHGIPDDEQDGVSLVGYRGALYRIDADYQVGTFWDGYGAIGCGAPLAQGALYASRRMQPIRRIRLALEAAERYNGGVSGPFVMEELPYDS